MRRTLLASKKLGTVLMLVFSLLLVQTPSRPVAAETTLDARYDKMSNTIVSQVSQHEFGFVMSDTLTAVGSVVFEFCSNSPISNAACTVPAGMDASSANLVSQTGETGFIMLPATTNKFILSRAPANPSGLPATYTFSNITNPSSIGSTFVRLQTYSSIDGTGVPVQTGGIVISINNPINVNAEVPPYLTFCVAVTITLFDCSTATNFFIDFGNFSPSTTSQATSEFIAASNAISGYSITVAGNTLTSGLNTIPEMTAPAGSTTGISQFGLNLRQNTIPSGGANPIGPGTATPNPNYNIPNQYTYNNGDIIASVTTSNDIRKFTANYIVNVSNAQASGVYSATISYIALANF